MSLINEALKKAQRMRNEEPADSSAATGSTPAVRIPKRSKAPAANTMVLIGSGALVLVVLSAVITVYLLNRPSDPAARVPSATPTPPAKTTPPEPAAATPPIVAPAISAPATVTSSETSVAAALASASPTAGAASAGSSGVNATPAAAPAASAPASVVEAAPASTALPPTPDARVTAFVEAIRVTGIRSSGTESRVLMNDRVYRVNDIVERALNVRLVKVAADSLTFSDANGITYEKHF